MKIFAAQMRVIAGRPDLNTINLIKQLKAAQSAAADLVIFPAAAVSGALVGDLWQNADFVQDCLAYSAVVCAATQNITAIFGSLAKSERAGKLVLHNAVYVAQNGQCIDVIPEDFNAPCHLTMREQPYTLGCLWGQDVAAQAAALLRQTERVDYFIHLQTQPFIAATHLLQPPKLAAFAAQAAAPLISVGCLGTQNTADVNYIYTGNCGFYLADGSYRLAPICTEMLYDGVQSAPPAESEIAAIYEALVFGLREFCANLGITRIVIGLSGGIDSAVTAALAVAALGSTQVLGVNLPSVYNSALTKNLAEQLAANLGIAYAVAPIQAGVELTLQELAQLTVTGAPAAAWQLQLGGLVEENIQARDRGSRLLAGIAAACGAGFLDTGNKTEATIGYATFHGDLAGFLAPIEDLWKDQVYALAAYINRANEYIPAATLTVKPSAELSAAQDVTQGLGDPLHYPYHDFIFRSWVEKKQDIADTAELYCQGKLAALGCTQADIDLACPTAAAFFADLERWWRLYRGLAVAKRIQSPPLLAISDGAFNQGQHAAQNSPYFSRRYYRIKRQMLDDSTLD